MGSLACIICYLFAMYSSSQDKILDIFVHVALYCRNFLVYEETVRHLWLQF